MRKYALRLSALAVSAAFVQPALASGYNFGTQSVSTQGTANASTVEAIDATTLYYNVAGMTYLDGVNISQALNLVFADVKHDNAKVSTITGQQVQGNSSGKSNESVLAVPHLYGTMKLSDRLSVGLGVYVPFGSSEDYDRNSVLRYNINQTSLRTIDINPAFAFKVTPTVSIGAGVFAQYADAKLRQYANFADAMASYYQAVARAQPAGSAAQKAAIAAATQASALSGVGPLDGYSEVTGNDWGFGYNLGVMWDVSPKTRVGLNYRSKVEHELTGDAKWTRPTSPQAVALNADATLAQFFGFIDSSARVKITTPASASFQFMHVLDDRTKLYADTTWTEHSELQNVDIEFSKSKITINPNAPASDTIYVTKWKDSWKVAVGASYQVSDPLQLRFGLQYDKSPVSSDDTRLTTLPDNDRFWISFGLKYAFDKQSSVNLAYSYIKIKDATANTDGYCGGTYPFPNGTSGAISPTAVNCVSSYTKGTVNYHSYANLVGMQYNRKF